MPTKGFAGLIEEIVGEVMLDCTVKLNELDCDPSGLLTRILQRPVAPRVIRMVKLVGVTFWIWVPLSVPVPPPGKTTATVRFC